VPSKIARWFAHEHLFDLILGDSCFVMHTSSS